MSNEEWWDAARKASQYWHLVAQDHAKGSGNRIAKVVPGSLADTVAPVAFRSSAGSHGRAPTRTGAKRKTLGAGS